MKYFKIIWRKLKGLFAKRPPSIEVIISEERAILAEAVEINSIYAKIQETSDVNEKEELIKRIARQEVAKEILGFVESVNTTTEKKKGKKKIYELHELRTELQKLEEQKIVLNLSEMRIQNIVYTDTASFDSRIDKLFSIISRNCKSSA